VQVLRVGAWVHFGLAGLGALMGLGYEEPVFLAAAVSAATVGLLLIGLDRVVTLLAEIRDALNGRVAKPGVAVAASESLHQDSEIQTSVRSLDELEANLARLRAKT
jgi:hypothetical protein